jgi:hypothetical protein
MSAPSLRRTRIGLLKTTHIPFVLAIKVFEGLYSHLSDPSSFPHSAVDTSPTTPTPSEPANKGKARKKFLSSRTGTNTMSLHFTDGPSVDSVLSPLLLDRQLAKARRKGYNNTTSANNGIGNGEPNRKMVWNDSGLGADSNDRHGASSDTDHEMSERERRLEVKVDDLSKKIEELMRIVLAGQGMAGDVEA